MRIRANFGAFVVIIACACAPAAGQTQVPTTLADFFGPGTQPLELTDVIVDAKDCKSCHGGYDAANEPFGPWAASMMGQAMRDPLFVACMAIAEQDAAFAGDLCLRCHTPGGWLEGRSEPTDGSALIAKDYQGVSCNFCHRMVDPVYQAGVSPAVDLAIINDLLAQPVNPHSGEFVMDPLDRRRGPFDLGNFNKHDWLHSPFHSDSDMCATCHDVSNPVYSRQQDGTYALNELDMIAPSFDKYDQFPLERTYSEWSASAFADGPVDLGGRFGGNKGAVSTCQDCHQPDATGKGCKTGEIRDDLPPHHFNGGNTWALLAVRNLYPDADTYLSDQSVADSITRTIDFLQKASDMELTQEEGELEVRVINQTGHKLPSGYPEGRRMWLNVRFLDAQGQLVAEHGHYDFATATLTGDDTKVYEAKLGVDQDISDATGIPVGAGFHFAVNNVWIKDNRIPPRGFTNSGFEAVQAAPVGYEYEDGDYWDDTEYDIPPGAASAEVTLYYQSASREYVEFLRDANVTNDAGDILFEQWMATGMSEPVEMDVQTIELEVGGCYADCNGDGVLNILDFVCFQNAFVTADPQADCNGDGALNILDFVCFQGEFESGCP